MKPFNIFIVLSLVVVIGGFIFFKGGFNKLQNGSSSSSSGINYLDYSEQNLSAAYKNGNTVLFFAATSWCQTCSELDKEIKERITEVPRDVTILKVDYDNDQKMKAKYAVVQQHTLVVLGKSGIEVKRWIGGNFDLMLNELKKI